MFGSLDFWIFGYFQLDPITKSQKQKSKDPNIQTIQKSKYPKIQKSTPLEPDFVQGPEDQSHLSKCFDFLIFGCLDSMIFVFLDLWIFVFLGFCDVWIFVFWDVWIFGFWVFGIL